MIGIGSSVYPPPKAMLEYLNLNKFEYKDIFNTIANNWRFCMKKSIPNAGTQILKNLDYYRQWLGKKNMMMI